MSKTLTPKACKTVAGVFRRKYKAPPPPRPPSSGSRETSQEGIDFENTHMPKPLRLLEQRSIQVPVFVALEFLNEDLLTLLASYGELKSQLIFAIFVFFH